MGTVNINGWDNITPATVILAGGSNHDVESAEYLLLVPAGGAATVTGFTPPSPDYTWEMAIANAGPDDLTFPHDNSGSTAGQRTMMVAPATQYTLSVGQTATWFFVPASLSPAPGWYVKVGGVLS